MFMEQDEATMGECCTWMGKRFFTKRKLFRLLPPLSWLPLYSLEDLKGDIISGISVAFTIVPQGLALASLAGLPPQYGLYTSFMGCFVYALLGSCKDMAVGPTSILAMIVLPYAMAGGPQYSILLAFLGGCLQLMAGILNLGFIVDFISFPVISAFSLAAAITISSSQLKGFFGLHYSASRVPEIWSKFFSDIGQVNSWDITLGCLCLLFLIPLQIFKDRKLDTSRVDPNARCKIFFYKVLNFLWNLLIIGRNAIAVILGSWIAVSYGQVVSDETDLSVGNLFTLSRKITPGLPAFQVPQFQVLSANGTVTKTFSVRALHFFVCQHLTLSLSGSVRRYKYGHFCSGTSWIDGVCGRGECLQVAHFGQTGRFPRDDRTGCKQHSRLVCRRLPGDGQLCPLCSEP